jgi:starvation-inducible DNA-binding protein
MSLLKKAVEDYVDDVTARVVQLGGVAEGTGRMAAKRSSLSKYPANTLDGRGHGRARQSRRGRRMGKRCQGSRHAR